ncbi:uncharacterized protein LOC5516144 isoform X2 [Nematostella vectensis]|uniref:uncharacterized protein LOC5516144 isoform X2 n=1 Tax=Nematostella vectensis TaxID=45351 RepID=UPI0020774499|nr:uncharacterized protein LOC5516144 isoform X2 [Nematostella vectensis]
MDAALSCYIIVQLSYLLSVNAEIFLASNSLNRRNAKSLGKFRKHSNKFLNVSEKLTLTVERPGACVLACLRNDSCFSLNLEKTSDGRSKFLCEVLSTDIYNSSSKIQTNTSWTHYSIDTRCFFQPCLNNGSCQARYHDDNYTCACHAGYTGRHCEEPPGLSCKDIMDQGRSCGSGKYYIDPEKTGSAFPVYCDMADEEGITMDALRELQQLTSFTQMRFVCHKQKVGRTLHIITTPDSKGKAVVDFFTAKTNNFPAACGSFTRGATDNSMLSGRCERWGRDALGHYYKGLWGETDIIWPPYQRMYDHSLFERDMYIWAVKHNCDDLGDTPTDGDFWKIFVR